MPKSDDEFEDIVVDALRLRFGNPSLVRFGRSGQNQHGIDGHDATAPASSTIVWQTTLQEKGILPKIQHDLDELDAGDEQQPSRFIVAIGRPRDAALQAELRRLSAERGQAGKCPVLPLFWDDLLGDLFADESVARKHFPELYARSSAQPQFSEDDLLVLTALNEHDAAEPEAWMSSFEVAVRTCLSPRDLTDTITILTESGHVESRPFAAGEKGGSPFSYQRARISAQGRRASRVGTNQVELPGRILPPSVNVPIDYPDKNVDLVLREQRSGFALAWEYETLLVGGAEPFEPVVEEVGLRPSRLQAVDGPGMLLLVRKPLRTVGEDEARELIKKQFPGAAYLEHKDGRWVAKRIESVPSPQGGPPVLTSARLLGEGITLGELLTNLRIVIPPQTFSA